MHSGDRQLAAQPRSASLGATEGSPNRLRLLRSSRRPALGASLAWDRRHVRPVPIETEVAIRPPSSVRPRGTSVIRSRHTRKTGSDGRRPSIREPHRLHPVFACRPVRRGLVQRTLAPPSKSSDAGHPKLIESIARWSASGDLAAPPHVSRNDAPQRPALLPVSALSRQARRHPQRSRACRRRRRRKSRLRSRRSSPCRSTDRWH